jgi:hypothetical protein
MQQVENGKFFRIKNVVVFLTLVSVVVRDLKMSDDEILR